MNYAPIISFAVRRHRMVTLEQETTLGMSRRQWYWSIESGRLEQVHPKVGRIPGSPATPEQRIFATVLACGEGTMGSHRSAVLLWVPDAPPDDIDVIVARRN